MVRILVIYILQNQGGQSKQGLPPKKAAESDSSSTRATPSDPPLDSK